MAVEMYENYVAIFDGDGTEVEPTKKFFLEHGATNVETSTDYIYSESDPDVHFIAFFVYGMTWPQAFKTRLEMGLHRDPRLPASHYVCMY